MRTHVEHPFTCLHDLSKIWCKSMLARQFSLHRARSHLEAVGMGQFIADVWNGRTFSLAKHYWLFLAVPSAIFSALVKVLEFNSLSFNPTTYGWVAGILWTITLIAFGFGYVGLINCARVRRFRGWSAVAVTVASLSLVLPFLMLLSGQSIDGTRAFRRDTGEATETCQTL